MRAVWWWIDRWRQSNAYRDFTPEQKGMYRDLLDEVWIRPDNILPDDDRILGLIVGDPERWRVLRLSILAKFKAVPGGWTHEVASEVIHQAQRRAAKQKAYRSRHGNAPGNARGNGAGNKPGSPSPSPSPSPSMSPLDGRRDAPAANPFLGPGDKDKLALECMSLVRRMADLTGEDPIEVIARASGYPGSLRTKVNPATMSDDRLINTVRDLRADVAAEEKKRAKNAGRA